MIVGNLFLDLESRFGLYHTYIVGYIVFALRCVFFWLTSIMIWDLSYPPILFSEGETERGQSGNRAKQFLGFFSSSIYYILRLAMDECAILCFLALIYFWEGGWISRVACVWLGRRFICPFMIYYSYTQLD